MGRGWTPSGLAPPHLLGLSFPCQVIFKSLFVPIIRVPGAAAWREGQAPGDGNLAAPAPGMLGSAPLAPQPGRFTWLKFQPKVGEPAGAGHASFSNFWK